VLYLVNLIKGEQIMSFDKSFLDELFEKYGEWVKQKIIRDKLIIERNIKKENIICDVITIIHNKQERR